jgi:hypothetical protein
MAGTSRVAPGTKVSQVLARYPFTFEVFLSHGCPDMRRGFFGMMAHVMSVERAAKMHRIPPETLVAALNAAIENRGQVPSDIA